MKKKPSFTKLELWEYFKNKVSNDVSAKTRRALTKLEKAGYIRNIVTAVDGEKLSGLYRNYGETLDGDSAATLVEDCLNLQKKGFAIVTWIGHDQEILIAAYAPAHLMVKEGIPRLYCSKCGFVQKTMFGERVAAVMQRESCLLNCTRCHKPYQIKHK